MSGLPAVTFFVIFEPGFPTALPTRTGLALSSAFVNPVENVVTAPLPLSAFDPLPGSPFRLLTQLSFPFDPCPILLLPLKPLALLLLLESGTLPFLRNAFSSFPFMPLSFQLLILLKKLSSTLCRRLRVPAEAPVGRKSLVTTAEPVTSVDKATCIAAVISET